VDLLHRAACHPVILVDEGPVQGIWALGISGHAVDEAMLPPLVTTALAGFRHVLVRVDTPRAMALDRIRARPDGRSRLDTMSTEAARRTLEQHAPLFDRVTTLARDVVGSSLVVLDGTTSPEAAGGQVADLIAESLGVGERFAFSVRVNAETDP